MIKGHFILPFSCYGFIAYLKTLGYQFPKFIDYNYDSVVDDDQRFNKYLEEVQRLLAIDINDWRALWNDNYNILEHNQKIFQDRPYDRIDFNELLQKR